MTNNGASSMDAVEEESLPSFLSLVEEYLDYANTYKRPSTFKRDITALTRILLTFEGVELSQITMRDIERFQAKRAKEVQPATVNRDMQVLKHLLNKAIDWGYIQISPARRVKSLREPPGRVRYLSESERRRLLDNCWLNGSDMLYPLVLTALLTGMRRGELRELIWDNINLEDCLIAVGHSKNNQSRVIPIHRDLLPVLVRLRSQYPFAQFVFCKPDGRPYGDWKRRFTTACERAGVKDFRFHDLRHTFASYLVMSGVDIRIVQQLLGHKDIKMTARYSHLSTACLSDAVNRIHRG